MVQLILTILCGAICWKQVDSAGWSFNNDLPVRRKASLFLKNKAIPGFSVLSSDEGNAPDGRDYSIPGESIFVDPELKSAVLRGNYPELDIKIPRPKMPASSQKVEGGQTDDQSIGEQLLNKKIIVLDPVEESILRAGNASGVAPANGAGKGKGGKEEELLSSTVKEGLKKFMEKVLECKQKIIYCKKKNLILCYLHCLLNDHSVGKVVKSNVQSLIKSLCDPLGTVFDASVKLFNQHINTIKTIKNFLTVIRIVPETFKRFTRLAANALPAILLKYSSVEEAGYFKTVLSGLETDAKAVESKTDIASELSNPACPKLDIFNAIQRVVGVIFKNPKIVNVFFPGLWTISKLFNLIHVPLVKVGLQAFGGALNILAGTNCGLVHFIQTGSNTSCNAADRVVWEASEHEFLSPEMGTPAVCGAVPYIPHRILQDDIFPPIFNQQEGENLGNNIESSTASKVANMMKDMRWVDDVIKTLDNDD